MTQRLRINCGISSCFFMQVEDLQQELEAAHRRTEALQNQIEEIRLYIDEAPELSVHVNAQHAHERPSSRSDDDDIQKLDGRGRGLISLHSDEREEGNGMRRSSRNRSGSETSSATAHGMFEILSPLSIGGSYPDERSALASRVLAIRNQNVQLVT